MDDTRRQFDTAYRDFGIGAVQHHRHNLFAVNHAWHTRPERYLSRRRDLS